MSVLQLVLYVLFLTFMFAWSANGHDVAVRAQLTHIDSARGFTKSVLLRRMAARTQARVDKRWSPPRPKPGGGGGANDSTVTAWVSRDEANPFSEYLIHFGIGTPRPQRVALTLDTGSDLVWTQCGCRSCFHQPFPALNASATTPASTASARGAASRSPGAPSTTTCASTSTPAATPGSRRARYPRTPSPSRRTAGRPSPCPASASAVACTTPAASNRTSPASPASAAGRCLSRRSSRSPSSPTASRPSASPGTAPCSWAPPATSKRRPRGPSNPPRSPEAPPEGPNSSLYYLSLKGVTVGSRRLPFDASTFALRGDGSGGTIIDSGTAITTFPRAVFRTLRDEFASQVSLPVADVSADDPDSMLCFSVPRHQNAPAVPKLILHLEGADWDLPRESYALDVEDGDGAGGMCVVINSAGDSGTTTVIGNFQQQNMHVAYDLGSNRLSFVPARCDKL